jgi:hypothetical protein
VARSCTLTALLVLVSQPFASAADPAPAPRPLHPRFDLTYLPKFGGQGVFGIRPAEIAKHATSAEVKDASSLVFGFFSQLLGGKELDAAAWPVFSELEQCACCLELRVTPPRAEGEQGTFLLGGKTPGLVRTVRPFDWDRMLRKSLPHATPARHAGRSYLRIPTHFHIPLPFIGALGEPMAAYIPDDRTLVLGSEGEIHALLDRLAAGKPAPEPLPGWRDVDRDLIAFALDNRDVPLIAGRFPDGYPLGKELEALAGSLRTLAVGLSTSEDRTRVRIVATAKDDGHARTAADALTSFTHRAAERIADKKEPDLLDVFGASLLKSAVIRRDGRNVTATLAADGNVMKMIFTLLRGPA